MRKEYDFSGGVRGAIIPPGAKQGSLLPAIAREAGAARAFNRDKTPAEPISDEVSVDLADRGDPRRRPI